MTAHISNPKNRVTEGTSFSMVAYFRDGATAAAPTTAQYRVDCLTTNQELTTWTDLTPAVNNEIAITATHNAIQNSSNRTELKQITVQSDQDTDAQTRSVSTWIVVNNEAF